MAAEFVTLRDGSGQSCHILPPGQEQSKSSEALVDSDRSFLFGAVEQAPLSEEGLLEWLHPQSAIELPYIDDANSQHSLEFALPPTELRMRGFQTYDEIRRNKIPTPTDKRGLVDVDELIEAVKQTVHPGYTWPGYCDQHHTLWPAYRYGILQTFRPDIEAVSFRNLAINKIWIPRVFHNWIHIVTEPPAPPTEKVMRESLEEWVVIRDFFASVKDTTRTMRIYDRERERRRLRDRPLNDSQEELLGADMRRRLGGVIMHFKDLEDIQLERWPISREMGLHAAAGQVGDLVLRGWQRRTKDVRRIPELAAAS